MEKFSFNSALMHFNNARGPSGFTWKFAAAYALVYLVLLAIFGGLWAALFGATYWELTVNPTASPDLGPLLAMIFGSLLFVPAFLIFWAVFESAALRRYVRAEGFSLKFGADEFRMIGVILLWMVFGILAYIVSGAIFFGAFGALVYFAQDNLPITILGGIVMVALGIAIGCFFLYWAVRLSPAGAVSIRDKKLKFLSAKSATKGRFWPMFGAFVIVYLVIYAAQFVLQMVIMGVSFGVAFSNPDVIEGDDFEAFLSLFLNPVTLTLSIVLGLAYLAFNAMVHYAWAGIPARAAVTDPTWGGDLSTADTFD